MMATTFNIAVSLVILVGFCAGGYPVAIMIYVVTGLLGAIFTNVVFAIPYMVFFGLVPILSMLIDQYIRNVIVAYVVRIIYCSAVVAVLYFFGNVISGEWLSGIIARGGVYIALLAVAAVLVLLLYERGVRYVQPILDRTVKRITRHD